MMSKNIFFNQLSKTSLTAVSRPDLLALLSQGAQRVQHLVSLGSVNQTPAEGQHAHTGYRVRQDLKEIKSFLMNH